MILIFVLLWRNGPYTFRMRLVSKGKSENISVDHVQLCRETRALHRPVGI